MADETEGYQAFALQVDSGAVISLLRRSVADILGLEYESGEPIDLGGVGGTRTNAFIHIIESRIGDSHTISAPYAIAESEHVPNLLGRKGIFDAFRIDFDGTLRETKFAFPWLDDGGQQIWQFFIELSEYIASRWDLVEIPEPAKRIAEHLFERASRQFAATAALMQNHVACEAPVMLRSLFELSVQFEHLLSNPSQLGPQYVDFAKVTRYRQANAVVTNPCGPIGEFVAQSPLRSKGEKHLEAEFKSVEARFRDKKGKLWRNWYGMSFEQLCQSQNKVGEYNLWYRMYSNLTHSDPAHAELHPELGNSEAFTLLIHYYGRILRNVSNIGRMVLTASQNEVLDKMLNQFA